MPESDDEEEGQAADVNKAFLQRSKAFSQRKDSPKEAKDNVPNKVMRDLITRVNKKKNKKKNKKQNKNNQATNRGCTSATTKKKMPLAAQQYCEHKKA
jgi:hypothetical protein